MAMRLTLRTLLAYLDRILEPADSQEMAKKIEESRAAAELMNRIRDVTKKVRLGAPPLEGKGLGLDPNTVAEYLDNTMPGEAVADFELVCLDSDMHLAEVAACHEVLSLVLVKAAEIEPHVRERMYGLTALSNRQPAGDDAPVTAVPVATPIAAPPVAAPEPTRRFEVPDYLRQSDDALPRRKRSGVLAAALALLALILSAGAAALALIPRENLPAVLHPLAELLFPQPGPAIVKNEPDGNEMGSESTEAVSSNTSATGVPPFASSAGSATTAQPPATGSSVPALSPSSASAGSAMTPATQGLRQPATALVPSAVSSSTSSAGAPLPPVPSGAVLPATTASATAAFPSVPPSGPNMPAGSGSPPIGPASPSGTATRPGAAASATAVPLGQPAKVEPVGRLSSAATEVMLRFDPQAAGWVRLTGRETLLVGDRLLALPGYRPTVALTNGVSCDLFGGTQIDLLPLDPSGTPGLRIVRGRARVFTAGNAQAKLTLATGTLQGTCTPAAADLGIEHQFRRPDGLDPTTSEMPAVLHLYVKSGEVEWTSPAATRFPAGSQWTLAPGSPPLQASAGAVPPWLATEERDALELQAAAIIEESLRGDKAVTVALKEAAEHRRIEVAQLAQRGLAQLGEYEALMAPLRDPTQRSSTWDRYLEWLTTALDYGPYYADKVREALVKQHGVEKGSALFRMLWGFDDMQLQNGAAKDLVASLDHPELDFRIVALSNLVRITGQSLGYAPQDPPLKRKQSIVKWEQKLAAGQIVRGKMP